MKSDKRLHHYIGQPPALPEPVAQLVANETDGDPVVVYAFADLDTALQGCAHWLILTERWCCFVDEKEPSAPVSFRRDQASRVDLAAGLSASQLTVRGASDGAPVVRLSFGAGRG